MTELVVVTDADLPGTDRMLEILRAAGLRAALADCRTERDVIEAAADATALVVQWAPVTERVLQPAGALPLHRASSASATT